MATNKTTLEFVIKATQSSPSVSSVLKDYSKNLDKAKKETINLNSALRALKVKPLSRLKEETEAYKIALARLKQAYKAGELSARDYMQAQVNLRNKLSKLNKTTVGLGEAFSKIKSNILAIVSASYALVSSFRAYSTFEHKMAEVNTLLDVSQKEFKNLRYEVLELTREIPQSANQLAAAEYDIISAGTKLEDSINVLKLSARAAIAGVTDTKTAVTAGMGVINAYGMSIDQLQNVYDALFMTVKQGMTTFPELAQSIGTVLPVAKSAGVSFDDVSAAIAALTKAGIKTPQAITGLREAISALSSPTAEAKKVMEELGITWKGFIPTLKDLIKYADKPDLMRKLVPDVEARVAVLALANNFKTLTGVLGEFNHKAGATQDAYKDIEDTPWFKIQLFKNELNRLMIITGGLISKALLPLVTQINRAIHGFDSLNKPTKYMIEVLMGAGAAFALWKMGLGSIVFSLGELLVSIHTTLPVVETFTGAITAAKAATIGGLIISIGVTGYNLWQLIKAITELNSVLAESKRLANKYQQEAEKYKDAANIQILTKEQLLALSEKERNQYQKNLVEAMRYYTNLANANRMAANEAKRFLGIPLPFQSEKAKEAEKNAKKLDQKVQEIQKSLHELRQSADVDISGVNNAMQSSEKVFELSIMNAKALREALTKAYKSAQKEVVKWRDKVVAYEQQIRRERMSTDELIRSLQRKTLTEEQAWYDKRQQAEETLAKAKEEYEKGNFDLAKELTEKAKRLYADLAQEVHKTNAEGQQVTVKTLGETTDVAVRGIEEASKIMTDIIKQQQSKAKSMEKSYRDKITKIQVLLKELTQKEKKDIVLDVPNYEKIKKQLDQLSIDITKHIHVKTIVDSSKPEKHKTGGIVGKYASGGKIPGYGGGDKVPALLEAGEYVVRKEAVKTYGKSFLDAVNSMRAAIPKFATGGYVVNFKYSDFAYKNIPFPIDLTDTRGNAFQKLLDMMRKYGIFEREQRITGSPPSTNFIANKFFSWWDKQQVMHKYDIEEAKAAQKEQKKEQEIERIQLALNLGGQDYPLEGDKSIVDALLKEIEKLRTTGYA